MACSRRPRPKQCRRPGTIVVVLGSVSAVSGCTVLLHHAGQDAPGRRTSVMKAWIASSRSSAGVRVKPSAAVASKDGDCQKDGPVAPSEGPRPGIASLAPAEELPGRTGNPLCRQRMRSAFEIFPQGNIPGRLQVTRDSHFSSNMCAKKRGAKRARTADLLHAMKGRHFH
jgi:hypothetical protein